MTAKQQVLFFPPWLAAEGNNGIPSEIRTFGSSAGDVTVDFRMARRPELITELIERCCTAADGGTVDRRLLLALPVGMRTEALVTLAGLGDPAPFCWRVRCPLSSCGLESEFELTSEQIIGFAGGERNRQTLRTEVAGLEVILRRPTGLDQARWLEQPEELATAAMLRSILVRPSLDELVERGEMVESVARVIDKAMDEFDPLVGFHASVRCPQCGSISDFQIDLTGAALERLARAQRGLIEEVHRLASRYHWSEQQILDLPEWRRQSYLALVEGESL